MKKMIIVMLSIVVLLCFVSCMHEQDNMNDETEMNWEAYDLQLSGSYYDNIDNFSSKNEETIEPVESTSVLTKAYLQSVAYSIIDFDEKNDVASVEITVPNLGNILPQIVTQALNENAGLVYEEIRDIVQTMTQNALMDPSIEKSTYTIVMPFEKIDGEIKLIYNDQWDEVVFGTLEELYLDYYRTIIGGLKYEITE